MNDIVIVLSHNVLAGPWQVVITGAPQPGFWYIFNTVTRRFRKIGRVGAKRTNYREVAEQTAIQLNAKILQDLVELEW